MMEIISALWPVFALLLLGYCAFQADFPGASFWPMAERGTYFVLFPVMLVDRLAQADLQSVAAGELVLMVGALVIIGSVLSFGLQKWLCLPAPEFTSFYQGSVRFNTYVGLAIVAALLDGHAVALAAMVLALLIPLLNLACVCVFAFYGENKLSLKETFIQIAKNPLIIACLLGLSLNLSEIGLAAPVAAVTELLSQVALPLGLLAVGAGLNLQALKNAHRSVLFSSLIKLILLPVMVVLFGRFMGVETQALQVITLFAALPTASAAYILARQMGGDAPAMAAIITGQTLLAGLTLPLVITYL